MLIVVVFVVVADGVTAVIDNNRRTKTVHNGLKNLQEKRLREK